MTEADPSPHREHMTEAQPFPHREHMTESEVADRSMRARIAAHVLHSEVDGREHTQPARDAWLAKFEREVDPDGVLAPDERARRAAHRMKAHMLRLGLRSAQVRR